MTGHNRIVAMKEMSTRPQRTSTHERLHHHGWELGRTLQSFRWVLVPQYIAIVASYYGLDVEIPVDAQTGGVGPLALSKLAYLQVR